MSVLLEFSMFPLDKGESLSGEVSRLLQLIRESGLPYRLTAMGTIIETDRLDTAFALVSRCADELQAQGSKRLYASLKLDIRDGPGGRLSDKVAAIERRIGPVDH